MLRCTFRDLVRANRTRVCIFLFFHFLLSHSVHLISVLIAIRSCRFPMLTMFSTLVSSMIGPGGAADALTAIMMVIVALENTNTQTSGFQLTRVHATNLTFASMPHGPPITFTKFRSIRQQSFRNGRTTSR